MRDRRLDHERFRQIRLATGMTQKQLASQAGVSESFVKLVERGKTQPSLPYASVLATALHCTVDDFTEPIVATSDAA